MWQRNKLTTSHRGDPSTRLGCLRFYRNLREITFRLTNVIPERIIFVSRGITVYRMAPLQGYLYECPTLQSELNCHTSNPVKVYRLHVKEPPLRQFVREPIQSAHIFVSLTQPLRFWWTLPVISPPVWFSQSNPLSFVTFIPPNPYLMSSVHQMKRGIELSADITCWGSDKLHCPDHVRGITTTSYSSATSGTLRYYSRLLLSITRSVLHTFVVQC